MLLYYEYRSPHHSSAYHPPGPSSGTDHTHPAHPPGEQPVNPTTVNIEGRDPTHPSATPRPTPRDGRGGIGKRDRETRGLRVPTLSLRTSHITP